MSAVDYLVDGLIAEVLKTTSGRQQAIPIPIPTPQVSLNKKVSPECQRLLINQPFYILI